MALSSGAGSEHPTEADATASSEAAQTRARILDPGRLRELREFYDNTCTADTMAGDTWETDVP